MRTAARNVLREHPAAPPGPPASGGEAAPPQAALEAEAEDVWETKYHLSVWFEDRRRSAIRQVVPAIAVGAALAVQKGAGFPSYVLLLALAALLLPLVVGRVIPGIFLGRESAGADPRPEAADESTEAVRPNRAPTATLSRRDLGVLAVSAGSLVALALLGGWPVVHLYVAAALCAVALLPRVVSTVWQSQVETAARLGLTTVVVGIVFVAQGGSWCIEVLVAGVQLGLLATVLEMLHTLRDRGRDLKAGRKTLVARFGVVFGQYQLALIGLLPFAMNICWVLAGSWGAALLTLLALPLGLWVIRDVTQNVAGPILDMFRPKAAAFHLAFAVLLAMGLLV
jgi:1,4-dihydroxy-2-naphthoate octaprenyltransferase